RSEWCREVASRARSRRRSRRAPGRRAAERRSVSVETALAAWVELTPTASTETAGPPWTGAVRPVSAAASLPGAVPSPSAEALSASAQTAGREGEEQEAVVPPAGAPFLREGGPLSP